MPDHLIARLFSYQIEGVRESAMLDTWKEERLVMKSIARTGYPARTSDRATFNLETDEYGTRFIDRLELEEKKEEVLSLEEKLEKILSAQWENAPVSSFFARGK